MKFKVDDVEHELDESTLTNREVMDIEAACGCTFGQWGDLLRANSMLATTALVWIALRRENPTLKFSDVEFKVAEVFAPPVEEDPDVPPTEEGSTPSPVVVEDNP